MSTPIRLAYIGNFEVPYSTESHVARSLAAIDGVKVIKVQENEADWLWIPHHAHASQTDFVLWTHTHYMAPESKHAECEQYLAMMREYAIPTVGYHLDRWWGLEREAQLDEPFFQQDLVITADGGHDAEWKERGINHVWMPPAVVHDEIGRGTARAEYRKDLGFVGGWQSYAHSDRWPWRQEMIALAMKYYGARFRAWPRGRAIRGAALNDLYASVRVLLGDSCLAPKHDGSPMTHYWSDRIPETLGRGGLLLHPDVEGLDEHFPIELPIRFNAGNRASLREAIERALSFDDDERDFLIDEAMAHVSMHHTYRHRMEAVIELVKGLRHEHVGRTEDDGGGAASALPQREVASAMDQQPETVRVQGDLHVTAPSNASGDDGGRG